MGFPIIAVTIAEVVSGVSGESESRIRDLFRTAVSQAPCVLLLDEFDAVAKKRESASKEMESRMVAQLVACIDGKMPKTCCFLLHYIFIFSSRF